MSALISADRIPKAFITLTINAALLLSRFAVAACLAGESLALFLGEAFSRTSALCELRWEAESRGGRMGREREAFHGNRGRARAADFRHCVH